MSNAKEDAKIMALMDAAEAAGLRVMAVPKGPWTDMQRQRWYTFELKIKARS